MAESESNNPLAHHFTNREQQYQAAKFGMWTFLVTEIMMFGALFLGYIVYRTSYPGAFHLGTLHLDLKMGGLNTVILIVSSLTMAMAVHAAQSGRRAASSRLIALTILLGLAFLGVKSMEYGAKFEHHLVPGARFQWHEAGDPGPVQIFFSYYFVMTGLHAAHMVVGIGLLLWVLSLSIRKRFSPAYSTPLEMVGLYWHFVDIVWNFLFPLLYLIGRHTT